jgi:general secretion pathway protein K
MIVPRISLVRQQGVAVITALLLTTLAVTIVASLFWQQQVQVRSIENQRTQLQKQWILRGAIDWARLILRSDVNQVDYAGDPWAIPLAEVRLDDFVENGKQDADASSATLSGFIVDAQSRFNLNALMRGGSVSPADLEAFTKLLQNLRIESAATLAEATAGYLTSARMPVPIPLSGAVQPNAPASSTQANISAASTTSTPRMMALIQVDDLLAISGFTSETVNRLKDYVTVLPSGDNSINVNTASAEVISAIVPGLSLSDATAVIASRDRAYCKDRADFLSRLPTSVTSVPAARNIGAIDVKTQYFLVNGKVKLNNAVLESQSLVYRPAIGGQVKVIWTREN